MVLGNVRLCGESTTIKVKYYLLKSVCSPSLLGEECLPLIEKELQQLNSVMCFIIIQSMILSK